MYRCLKFALFVITAKQTMFYTDAFVNSFGYESSFRTLANQISSLYYVNRVRKESSLVVNVATAAASVGIHPFNPFTARNKNTAVKWFESEMEDFYMFVEGQSLLSAEEELQCGKAMRMWFQVENMRASIERSKKSENFRLSDAELAVAIGCSEEVLSKMCQCAELAQSRLLNCNLKLVLAVVSRYRSSNIPNSELIAEGTRGLSRAVLRYDYSKGFRFATYATWYVHQAVADYVKWRKNPAKMPSRYSLLYRRIKTFSTEFRGNYTRMPTIDEIAVGLNHPHYDVVKSLSMQVYPIQMNSPLRNQHPHGTQRQRTFEEILPSHLNLPQSLSNSVDIKREMEHVMTHELNDVERDVMRLRLGLDDGREKPIKEIGRRFHVSWKHIRAVEKEAINKLQASELAESFANSYNSES